MLLFFMFGFELFFHLTLYLTSLSCSLCLRRAVHLWGRRGRRALYGAVFRGSGFTDFSGFGFANLIPARVFYFSGLFFAFLREYAFHFLFAPFVANVLNTASHNKPSHEPAVAAPAECLVLCFFYGASGVQNIWCSR